MKKLIALIVLILAFAVPSICDAGKNLIIIVDNSFDEKILVYVDSIDHKMDYPFPRPVFGGEIGPGDHHVMAPREHNQSPYRYRVIVCRLFEGTWREVERRIVVIGSEYRVFFITTGG